MKSPSSLAIAVSIAVTFTFSASLILSASPTSGATGGTPAAASSVGVGPTLSLTPSLSPAPIASSAPSPSPSEVSQPKICGPRTGKVFTYRVWIEPGQKTNAREFQQHVQAVLCDARGWLGSGTVRFRFDPKGAKKISLRSSSETERRCTQILGRPSGSYFSCAGRNEAVLNAARWFGGSRYLTGSVATYRQMLVNHEVGHLLGMRHRGCPGKGRAAPVMMQQSKGLHGCFQNQWPTRSEERALPWGRRPL